MSLLSLRLLPETRGPRVRLDLPGVALVSGAVVGLVWGLVRAGDAGWTSREVVTALAAGVLLLGAFVLWERRAPQPLVPLRMLRVPAFATGNATAFLMAGSTPAAAFLIAQYFQFALGYSPLETGVRLLPFFITPMLVSPVAGALSDRIGARVVVFTGLSVQALGFAWFALRVSPGANYIELVLALCVAGVGISMALPTVPTAVLGSVEASEIGTASGVNNMMGRFGTVFGVAIASSVFTAAGSLASPASLTDGLRPALAVAAAFSLLGAGTGLALPGRPRALAADPLRPSRRPAHPLTDPSSPPA